MIESIHLSTMDMLGYIPGWIVAVLFFVPFCGGIILYFYKTRHARSWRKGIYPASLKFNQDNLLEAYLAIGSLLILIDYQRSKGKTTFINSYFNRYFKSANYNFGDSLLFSMRHPLQINTACAWLNANLNSEGERSQVIYFLTGLAMLDESLSQKELKFLQLINEKLELPIENLHRIVAIYQTFNESRENESKDKWEDRKRTKRAKNSNHFHEILNVSKNASLDEIKKSYRSLVKQHHPDVFANASEAQQKMAEEKFLKIQEAYEGMLER
jgi:DnaJ like chaperone protein